MVVTMGLGACGGAANGRTDATLVEALTEVVQPFASPALGLFPGEQMTFDVTLGGVQAGEAALAVGEVGAVDGRESIVVSSRVASAGAFRWVKEVEDALTSTVDVASGLPRAIAAEVAFGEKRYHANGQFDGPKVQITWHRGDDRVRHLSYDFRTVDAHDAHSAMAAMRGWEAAPGEARRLYVIGGRRIWRTDVTWIGRETIGTRMGNQATVRLDGTSFRVKPDLSLEPKKSPRRFSVWMSDDADRVPLKVVAYTELGDVVIELTGYERP